MDIAETVAVITGGASGIGRGTALALARAGADIVVADINMERAAGVRAEIEALGRRAIAVRCDVSRNEDLEQLAVTVAAAMGHVDILMNNAGVVLRGALEQIDIADWEWSFGINVLGVVRGIRAFLPQMLRRGRGHIINTASVAGLLALTGEGAPYIASKFAVVGLTEALALYARPMGIDVSLLCPARVESNLGETLRSIGMTPERELSEAAAATAIQGGELMTPEQIGAHVVDAVQRRAFFVLPDPYLRTLLQRRLDDMSGFLEARLAGTLEA